MFVINICLINKKKFPLKKFNFKLMKSNCEFKYFIVNLNRAKGKLIAIYVC